MFSLDLLITSNHAMNIPSTDCPALDAPDNGRVSYIDDSHGSVATYSCNHGYILLGYINRTCYGGIWSGYKPFCKGMHMYVYKIIWTLFNSNNISSRD